MADRVLLMKYLYRLQKEGYPITSYQRRKFCKQFYEKHGGQSPDMAKAILNLHSSIRKNNIPVWMSLDSNLRSTFTNVVTDYRRKMKELSESLFCLPEYLPETEKAQSTPTKIEPMEESMEEAGPTQSETSENGHTCQREPDNAGVNKEQAEGSILNLQNLETQLLEMEMDRDNLKEVVQLKETENKKLREQLEVKTNHIRKLEEKLEKVVKDGNEEWKIRNLELEKEVENLKSQRKSQEETIHLYEIIVRDKGQMLVMQRELMDERTKIKKLSDSTI